MHLRLNFRAEFQHFDFAVQKNRQELQPFLKIFQSEDDQFFRIGDVHGIRNQVHDPLVVLQIEHGDFELFRKIR